MNGPKFLPRTVKKSEIRNPNPDQPYSMTYLVQRPARLVYRVRAPRVGLKPSVVTGAAPGGKYCN